MNAIAISLSMSWQEQIEQGWNHELSALVPAGIECFFALSSLKSLGGFYYGLSNQIRIAKRIGTSG